MTQYKQKAPAQEVKAKNFFTHSFLRPPITPSPPFSIVMVQFSWRKWNPINNDDEKQMKSKKLFNQCYGIIFLFHSLYYSPSELLFLITTTPNSSPPTHTPNSFAGRTPKIKLSFFHLILFWASHVREIWLFSSSSPIDVEYKNKLEEKWITFSNFFLVSFFLLSEFTSQCERSSSMGKNVLFCRFLFTWFNFSSSAWLVAFAFHRLFILFFFSFFFAASFALKEWDRLVVIRAFARAKREGKEITMAFWIFGCGGA